MLRKPERKEKKKKEKEMGEEKKEKESGMRGKERRIGAVIATVSGFFCCLSVLDERSLK